MCSHCPRATRSSPTTSLALGPDWDYYVGELGGDPPKGHARGKHLSKVYRLDPKTGKLGVFASGFDDVTGVAFDKAGNLYVTEMTINLANQNEVRGEVVRVAPGGALKTFGFGKLIAPQGAAIGPDGNLYVSNFSVLPASTPANGPFHGAGGQLVRITLH